MSNALQGQTVAIIGGTGALGSGLAKRLAASGVSVIIGSRTADKAQETAKALAVPAGAPAARGMANADAAAAGSVVMMTVPFSNQAAIIAEIKPHVAGKIVIDTTVPLVPPKVARVQLPPEGSAAVIAQQVAGEAVAVVAAFHNVSADSLHTDDDLDCDVLVTGNKVEAREAVVALAKAAGLRAWHAGALENAAAAEALTSVLIFMNKRYGGVHTGIRITGIPDDAA